MDDEQVVISGISGTFPGSENVKELSDILYNKINPITLEQQDWGFKHFELPDYVGKIPSPDLFDAQFFRVFYQLCKNMDPMARKLMEHSYQAIYDAGVNPSQLWGKNVGVFIGCSGSETEKAHFFIPKGSGVAFQGVSRTMFANRISYWLNTTGPSYCFDAGCCSSMVALEQAQEAMRKGDCEAALVGACNLCCHPQSTILFGRLTPLNFDGKTKSFDKSADGCTRSEAVNVIFLQKAKDAKRIYAELIQVKTEFGSTAIGPMGQKFGPYRDSEKLAEFLKQCYKEANISPSSVEYVEALGSGAPEADKAELEAFSVVYCKDKRAKPLLVGSVVSNIGHTDTASGSSAIIKVLLGYKTGKLAANLHCENPREDIDALRQGTMQVVNEHMSFNRSYTAVSNLGYNGLNAHVLLRGCFKPKDLSKYDCQIPRLVMASGRQEPCVQFILDDLKTRPLDAEELALLYKIHDDSIKGHLARGYSVLATNDGVTTSLAEKVEYYDDAGARPLWFLFSGMGSQWPGMGRDLLRIPVFANSIARCHGVLKSKGIDIYEILTCEKKSTFEGNILNCFIGIVAVQIGITDVLHALGLKPDKIIGHSLGEIGCAYADGCLSAEQMITMAYCRGTVSKETSFIHGTMAAVGIGFQKLSPICPPEIDIACHNSSESTTISGPTEIVEKFIAKLTAQGVFVKKVPSSDIAYHSRYINKAGPSFIKSLRNVIKDPPLRSDKWLSTSIPQDKWDTPLAKYSSPEYHTNNLLSPVYFEEALPLFDENAVVIEIAPHALLQAILKRSLPSSVTNIPLTRRGHPDNAVHFLDAIGKLYTVGYHPKIEALYPKVEFPVSTDTPMLSHLIDWIHDEKWSVTKHSPSNTRNAPVCTFSLSTHEDEYKYLKGHNIEDKTLCPFSAALVFVWDTLAMSMNVARKEISVEFRDVFLHRQPRLEDSEPLQMRVSICRGSGNFEVLTNNLKVISGTVFSEIKYASTVFDDQEQSQIEEEYTLNTQDVYKLLDQRGYSYKDEFKSISKINDEMTRAAVLWNNNWVTLIDAMFQVNALQRSYEHVSIPKYIQRILIDVTEHENAKVAKRNEQVFSFEMVLNTEHNASRCGGVTIEGIEFKDVPFYLEPVSVKSSKFVPFIRKDKAKIADVINVFAQIVFENVNKEVIDVIEFMGTPTDTKFKKMFADHFGQKINYKQVAGMSSEKLDAQSIKTDLVLVHNLTLGSTVVEKLFQAVNTLVINVEIGEASSVPTSMFHVLAAAPIENGRLVLGRWRPVNTTPSLAALSVNSEYDIAVLRDVKKNLRQDQRLMVITSYPLPRGLKELIQEWRQGQQRDQFLITAFTDEEDKYSEINLPQFNLAFNILKDGFWGGEYLEECDDLEESSQLVSLQSAQGGDIDSLFWVEMPNLKSSGIDIKVHYAGLNVFDAFKASGSMAFGFKTDDGYGMDFSGVTLTGNRVMGLVANKAASSRVKANPSLLWPVPAHWSLEDAATVPLPYAQAFYCLAIRYQVKPGMSVLVHGGAGALGQAIISIALAHGCEVFTTVGDEKKKKFLRKLFPTLSDDHIGNSRDTSFEGMVKAVTNRLCDVVITSAQKEHFEVTASCVAETGILLDTSPRYSVEPSNFGMSYLSGERQYRAIVFSSLFKKNDLKELKTIQFLISDGIARGFVRPLSRVTFNAEPGANGARRALRMLTASRHRGRVLLKLHEMIPPSVPRISVSPSSVHLLFTDANDGLSVDLAATLAKSGATHLVLHANASTTLIQHQARMLADHGVQLKVTTDKVTSLEQVQKLMKDINEIGELEGVFVAITGNVENQSKTEVENLVGYLDTVTRKMCHKLKYFAAIRDANDIGTKLFEERAKNKLPSTLLVVSNYKGSSFAAHTVRALEKALRVRDPVVVAVDCTKSLTVDDIIARVADITGIVATDSSMATYQLQNLDLDDDKYERIQTLLLKTANVSVTKMELSELTMSSLRQLISHASSPTASETLESNELSLLYNHVDSDELHINNEMISIPTLVYDHTRYTEHDKNETYLVMIPDLEGDSRKFMTLGERLKIPAIVLQPGMEHPKETVTEMAERLVEIMIKRTSLKDGYYLLGYSFGVLVAMEMASILESRGVEGKVFCVDATPLTYPESLNAVLNGKGGSSESLQNALLLHLYSLIAGTKGDDTNLDALLKGLASWDEKLEACVGALRRRVKYSTQYIRAYIDTAYNRIESARLYKPELLLAKPLRSQLVLLRSPADDAFADQQAESIARFSVLPPHVFELNNDHARALQDPICATIVNRHLSDTIQNAYDRRNLCDLYSLHTDIFMNISK